MSVIKAFTITAKKNNPRIKLLKECYIMRHAHISHCIWNTKIKVHLAHLDDTMDSIIEMYEDQLQVPYIHNIKRGDVVTKRQFMLLGAWEVSRKYLNNTEKTEYEV